MARDPQTAGETTHTRQSRQPEGQRTGKAVAFRMCAMAPRGPRRTPPSEKRDRRCTQYTPREQASVKRDAMSDVRRGLSSNARERSTPPCLPHLWPALAPHTRKLYCGSDRSRLDRRLQKYNLSCRAVGALQCFCTRCLKWSVRVWARSRDSEGRVDAHSHTATGRNGVIQ